MRATVTQAVIHATCEIYGVSRGQLLGVTHKREIAWPRQMAMAVIREIAGISLPQIGKAFNRDHTTVIYAIRAVNDRCLHSPDIKNEYDELIGLARNIKAPMFIRKPVFKSVRGRK